MALKIKKPKKENHSFTERALRHLQKTETTISLSHHETYPQKVTKSIYSEKET